MMRAILAILAVAAVAGSGPASAQTTFFAAEFDAERPVSLQGEVTLVNLNNGRSHIVVTVHGVNNFGQPQEGSTLGWAFQVGSVTSLAKIGLTKETLQNRTVTLAGFQSKDTACTREMGELQSAPFSVPVCRARGLIITFANGCTLPLAPINSDVPGTRTPAYATVAASTCKP